MVRLVAAANGNMEEVIHIACAANENYVPHCAAMLHSALTVDAEARLIVHFLHDDELSSRSEDALRRLVESLGGIWMAHLVEQKLRDYCPENRRYGQVAWYRVMLPWLLEGCDRVLYLDADTIIRRSLKEIWQSDLSGRAVGAVCNPLYPFMGTGILDELGLSAGEYFNSGVMLFDLESWRSQELTEQVLERAKAQGSQEWPDQNALNVVLRHNWFPLPPKWNCQNTLFDLKMESLPFVEEDVLHARHNPAIIHYIGAYKPWHLRCKHSLKDLYWHHLAQTPWSGRQMEGNTVRNHLLRLLPEQQGWLVEASLRAMRKKIFPASRDRQIDSDH